MVRHNNSVTINYSAKEMTEYWNKKSSNIYYLQKHMVTKQKLWGGGGYIQDTTHVTQHVTNIVRFKMRS